MMVRKQLWIMLLIAIAVPLVCAKNKTSKEWAGSAQKSIWEVSQIFHRASIGLGSFDKEKSPYFVELSKKSAKLAGVFGVFGALFSIVLAFIPGSDSGDLKLIQSEFGKLSQKVDTIARSLEDTKNLIKLATQKAAYIEQEQRIHHGFSQLEICLQKLENVSCSAIKECKRKKMIVAEGYIESMNVMQSVEAILRGVTSDSAFGKPLLYLLKEESECNVPRINLFANKVTALITKGMTVSMFYDLMTKADYNVLDGTVLTDKMLRRLDIKRQHIQHQCLNKTDYWIPLDVENSQEQFTADIQTTNTKVLQTLKTKYPWIWWHVLTHKGEHEPETGPKNSPLRLLYSSSKASNVHCFAIPTNNADVDNLNSKIKKWKKIVASISSDAKEAVQDIENRIKSDLTLKNNIQSFAILPGEKWVLGHYDDEMKQRTLGVQDVSTANVFVNKPQTYFSFVVAVSFVQTEYPPDCSKTCNDKGICYIYPYSTQMGCRCKYGYNGENCESSGTSLKLKSVINSILLKTMKLPTFATIQQSIEDTQLYLKTSTENIQMTITKLGERIDEQFKSLGEFMSNKFDWFNVMFKYKEAIENLNYFHSISNEKVSDFHQNSSILTSSPKGRSKFAMAEDKNIAQFLLSPTGIRKWLYQINFLIVGRRDSQFNSHKPLLFMVMEKYKNRVCSKDYKREITRTYRQLMLLQLQGYMLWSNAYSIANRDSSAISEKYTNVLQHQQEYLQKATCPVKIPHSTNLHSCSDGYFFHKSLKVDVICKSGYFAKGKCKHAGYMRKACT